MTNGSARILHVDDDPGLARLVQRALARRGYDVENVASSEEGLARLGRGDIDLVVLDHFLPTGTGLDFLASLRAQPARPPVVYVTAASDAVVAIAALKAGASDYVLKTVGEEFFELLVTSVDQALEKARLQQERDRAELEVRRARDRAVVLLNEVNHRVANSLALVAALVAMQAKSVTEPSARAALDETQNRISAIAGVHRRLYTSEDVRSVEVADYLSSLLRDLEATMRADGHASTIRFAADRLEVPTDKTVSLGVIVTELVTNAFKYAYPRDRGGEIRVTVRRIEPDQVKLTVEDDGVGWTGNGPIQGTGVGSRIIQALAKGLGTDLVYVRGPGCRAALEFGLS